MVLWQNFIPLRNTESRDINPCSDWSTQILPISPEGKHTLWATWRAKSYALRTFSTETSVWSVSLLASEHTHMNIFTYICLCSVVKEISLSEQCINNSTWAILHRAKSEWFKVLFYPGFYLYMLWNEFIILPSLCIYSEAHCVALWKFLRRHGSVWDCQFSVFALAESCIGRWRRRVSAGELNVVGADVWEEAGFGFVCDRCVRGFSLWLWPSRAPSHTSSSESTCSRRGTALNLRAARWKKASINAWRHIPERERALFYLMLKKSHSLS